VKKVTTSINLAGLHDFAAWLLLLRTPKTSQRSLYKLSRATPWE